MSTQNPDLPKIRIKLATETIRRILLEFPEDERQEIMGEIDLCPHCWTDTKGTVCHCWNDE